MNRADTPCVAIVDDEAAVREATESLLRSAGLRVASFASAEDFLRGGTAAESVACLILDINLPGMNGLQLNRFLRLQGRAFRVILITASDDSTGNIRSQAARDGAHALLFKPFLDEDLLGAVRSALQG